MQNNSPSLRKLCPNLSYTGENGFHRITDLQFGFFYPHQGNAGSEICYYWKLSEQKNIGKRHFLVETPNKFEIVIERQENKFTKIEFPRPNPEGQLRPKKNPVSYYTLDGCPTFSHLDFNPSTEVINLNITEATSNFAINNFNDILLQTYLARSTVLRVIKASNPKNKKIMRPWKETNLKDRMPFLTYKKLKKSKISYEIKFRLLCCLTQLTVDLFLFTEKIFEIFKAKKTQDETSLVIKVLEDFCLPDVKPQAKPSSCYDFEEVFWNKYEKEVEFLKFSQTKNNAKKIQVKNVYLTPSITIYSLKGFYQGNTILREYFGKIHQFLVVNIRGEDGKLLNVSHKNILYQQFRPKIEELRVLTRKFKFLAYSASQLRKASFWMLNETSNLGIRKIRHAIGDLSNQPSAAKYGIRLGQLFADSWKGMIIDRNQITFKVIPDLKSPNGQYLYSDGIGMISANLVNNIKSNLKISGKVSALQVRIGGVKGILAVNKSLRDNTILVRPSMIKFKDSSFENEISVLKWNKYQPANLNTEIILLLLTNGVDGQVFLDLQQKYIQPLKRRIIDQKKQDFGDFSERALKIIQQIHNTRNHTTDFFGEGLTQVLIHKQFIHQEIAFKQRISIPVPKAAILMGVVDEHGVLGPNEVFVCISPSNGMEKDERIIQSKVVVTKNPCLHPGDIRILNAVKRKEVCQALGNFVNCIVFPFNEGQRPHPNKMGGGDLDGDIFFVIWDQRLIPKNQTQAASYNPPQEKSRKETKTVIDFLCEFNLTSQLGKIANSHLAFADQSPKLANSPICLHLHRLYSQEIDYFKTGFQPRVPHDCVAKKFPEFMEKDISKTCQSQTILGELYKNAKEAQEVLKPIPPIQIESAEMNRNFIICGFKDYLQRCFEIKEYYTADIEKIKFKYNLETEYEIFASINLTEREHDDKQKLFKQEENIAIACEELYQKYHTLFYQDTTDIFYKVSALYFACYYDHSLDYSQYKIPTIKKSLLELKPVGLPWLIAGEQLLFIKAHIE